VNILRKRWIVILTLVLVFAFHLQIIAKPSILSKRAVNSDSVRSQQQLIRQADLIVYGRYDTAQQIIRTSRKVSGGRLANYIQPLHVHKLMKGDAGRIIRILSTGVEPLPDPGNSLNRTYPGPMAEGEYICFLKKIKGKNLYRLIGGWQGVYPILDGKSVAIADSGFPALSGLTPTEFYQLVKSAQ
jgi:hypothetical protein